MPAFSADCISPFALMILIPREPSCLSMAATFASHRIPFLVQIRHGCLTLGVTLGTGFAAGRRDEITVLSCDASKTLALRTQLLSLLNGALRAFQQFDGVWAKSAHGSPLSLILRRFLFLGIFG